MGKLGKMRLRSYTLHPCVQVTEELSPADKVIITGITATTDTTGAS
jgi:hypothetical protein